MNAAASGWSDTGRFGLALGFVVSLALHAGAAWWLSFTPLAGAKALSVEPAPPADPEEEDPLRLGLALPENASIAWLGVMSDPLEAQAPESEVDQAALSPSPGEEAAPEPAPPPDPAMPAEESPVPPPEPETPEPEPESRPEPEREPEPAPLLPFPLPTEPAPPEIPAFLDEPPLPDPAEMGPPVPTEADRREPPPPEPAPPAQPSPQPSPAPEGAPGELDERASDAAMRRSAKDLPIDRLGRPLQASGDLHLNTVRPTWSLQVRNAYSPRRNPYVEILFGADGRVKLAQFVRMPDGSRGSGYEEVDQPLLNAVYRWTARGEAIETLRGTDRTHRIVIRFLLVPPVPGDEADPSGE